MNISTNIGETTEKPSSRTAKRNTVLNSIAGIAAVVLLSTTLSVSSFASDTSSNNTLAEMDNFTITKALESHPIASNIKEHVESAEQAEKEATGTKKVSYVDYGKVEEAEKKTNQNNQKIELSNELQNALNIARAEKEETQKKKEKEEAEARKRYFNSEEGKRERLVEAAKSRLGVPYVYGGTDPNNGMDCSGFVQWCYSQIDMDIPRTTYSQCDGANAVIDVSEAKPGDILYSGGHVGLYIGDGTFIHEPQSGDVCRESTDMGQFYSALRYI